MVGLQVKYESPPPPEVDKEVSLSQWRIPRRLLWRQLTLSTILIAIPVFAFWLDVDTGLKWGMLVLSVFFSIFSLLASGVLNQKDQDTLDVVKYYGRGTLIVLGSFWLVIVTGLIYMLFVSFPR